MQTGNIATKMDVMYNNMVIGKLLRNNILMVNPSFIIELKRKFTNGSPNEEIKDYFNIFGDSQTSQELVQFTIPINMSLSIETAYMRNESRYVTVAVIRENIIDSFPETN